MPYTIVGRNTMLAALGVTHVSLHTGDPAETGANELTGGTPDYARVPITFNAPAAGTMDSSNTPTLNVPAGTTVAWVGFWNALAAGTFLASSDVTDEVFAGQGTYEVSDADLDLNLT